MFKLGVFLTSLGGLGALITQILKGTDDYKVASSLHYFGYSNMPQTVDTIFTISIFVILLGIALIIGGYLKKNHLNTVASNNPQQPGSLETLFVKRTCVKCGAAVSADVSFCPKCGAKTPK